MRHLTEQRIIGGFNRKESGAIAWIYEVYHGKIFNMVRKSTACSPDVEDLVADVFYKLIKNPRPFERLKQIEYFLYKTAKNTCLDHLRHQQVKRLKSGDVENFYRGIEDCENEAAQIKEQFDQLMQVAAAKLTPQCRQIIVLSYAHGLGNQEIALRLGLSEKTVANLKTLAMKALKLVMKKTGNDGLFML